jgi:hypothetical protein
MPYSKADIDINSAGVKNFLVAGVYSRPYPKRSSSNLDLDT